MKKFTLKIKTGEQISKITANDLNEAQIIFSKIKRLSIRELLGIFLIEEEIK
jgi:hypothetical protein